MIVVSDTSAIRALANLGRLELLHVMFGAVLVPPAVATELEHPTRPDLGVLRVDAHPFMSVRAPANIEYVRRLEKELDPGESEAIALAIETRADVLLIDEAQGRTFAVGLGLHCLGVFGILLRAKSRGLVAQVLPLADRLQHEFGFFVSPRLRETVRRLAGE